MKYGIIGRSHTSILAEHLEHHEQVFFGFAVPLGGFFNDSDAGIVRGCLKDDKRANFFARFNIEKLIGETSPDFLVMDLYGSIRDDLFYDESGNIIPAELTLYERDIEDLKQDYGWINLDDSRYYELIERSLHRLAWLLNHQFPGVKLLIAETLPVNSYEDEHEREAKPFVPFEWYPRYGSEETYFNMANYRLNYAAYLGRLLAQHVSNCGVLRAPLVTRSMPPFEVSSTHFTTADYRQLAGEIDWHMGGAGTSPPRDEGFSIMTHSFRAHRALMAVVEQTNARLERVEQAMARIEQGLTRSGPEPTV